MKKHSSKINFFWWISLAATLFLTFLGRYWVTHFYPSFGSDSLQILEFDVFNTSNSLLSWFGPILGHKYVFSGIISLGLLGSIGILYKKTRKISLGILLLVLLIVYEIQYIFYHVGDTLLLGIIIFLLFGKKHKWLFLQLFLAFIMLLNGIDKALHGNYFSGDALINLSQEVGTTYSWYRYLLSQNEPLTRIISILVPLLQATIGVSMFLYIFTHNKIIRLWGCIILPCFFIAGLSGLTIGLLPVKFALCLFVFYFPAKKLSFPKKEYWTYSIPLFFLASIIILNTPTIRHNGHGNYFFLPFGHIETVENETTEELDIFLKKSPWLLDRYSRFYYFKKSFLKGNRMVDCKKSPEEEICSLIKK